MDIFGIGAAMRGALQILLRAQRATDRSTLLLSIVKPGDEVVFVNAEQARLFERAMRERVPAIVGVQTRVCDPARLDQIMGRYVADGRMLFDHVWVEQFYQNALDGAISDVDLMQTLMSSENPPVPKYTPCWTI